MKLVHKVHKQTERQTNGQTDREWIQINTPELEHQIHSDFYRCLDVHFSVLCADVLLINCSLAWHGSCETLSEPFHTMLSLPLVICLQLHLLNLQLTMFVPVISPVCSSLNLAHYDFPCTTLIVGATEKARPENEGPSSKAWKFRTWKWRTWAFGIRRGLYLRAKSVRNNDYIMSKGK